MRYAWLFILVLVPFALAHAGEEHETTGEATDHLAAQGSINPFTYFSAGMLKEGTVALVLWTLSLFALMILAFPLLKRIFSF